MNPTNKLSRRGFIGTSAAAAATITVVPSNTIAGLGHKAPSDKLNIAGVGIGGMGFAADLIRHNYREGWSLPDMPA